MSAASPPWRVAWITGASSGIGREVALALAAKGVAVAASARTPEALAELARGQPRITPFPLDVRDRAATAATVAAIEDRLGPIDLALLNAGTWAAMRIDRFDAQAIADAMAVNYQGVVNGLEPLLPRLIARRSGRIGIVASVAGYRGLPRSAAYAPTKAALINLAETLAAEAAPHGIGISIINPGFVATPMTAVNTFPMPFLIPAEAAARRIVRGLERGRYEIAFPLPTVVMTKLARLLPNGAFLWVSRTFLARPRRDAP